MTITAITTTRTSSLTSTTSTRPTLTSSASLERILSKCQQAASDHLARGKAWSSEEKNFQRTAARTGVTVQ